MKAGVQPGAAEIGLPNGCFTPGTGIGLNCLERSAYDPLQPFDY